MNVWRAIELDSVPPSLDGAPVFHNSAGRHLSIIEEIGQLRFHGHLLKSLVMRDLTVRYKRSALGFLWTMLNPLLMMIVLTLVFSTFFRFAIDHYETYFLSEYLAFIFFSQTTINAMLGMAWNGPLMKRVRVPKTIFAVSATASGIANLVLSCLPLALIMLAVGAPIRPAVAFLPISFLILGVFTLGVSLAMSALGVYFADVKEMYQILILVVMYLTPMFYPLSIVPDEYLWAVKANPMLYLLQIVRDPIYYGRIPTAHDLVVSTLLAIVAMTGGWLIFRRLSRGFYAHL